MGASEKQPDRIQFTNMDGRVAIHDLDLNRVDYEDDRSNASDESFDHDEEYQNEFYNKTNGDEDLATDIIHEDHSRTQSNNTTCF